MEPDPSLGPHAARPHHGLRLRSSHHLLRIQIDRPDRLNAIDAKTFASLILTLREARAEGKPLLLTGSRRLFSIGADVRELVEGTTDSAARYSLRGQRVVAELERWPAPTMALLRGHCLGAGLELALGCDVIAAAPDVQVGLPGLAFALLPCLGGMRRLAARTRSDLAGELFLGGQVLDAQSALKAGIIDRLVDGPRELAQVLRGLRSWTPNATAAVRAIRLERQGPINPRWEAGCFARPFLAGECQRRLRALLSG